MQQNTQNRLNDPRTLRGWAFFDWANSAFALVITAAIFPAYYVAVTDDQIELGALTLSNSSLYAYAISCSYLLIAALSPLLSGIADYGGRRKFFLKFFTILGSAACLLLFFFDGMDTLGLGAAAFMAALIGFAGALVFYNAFLPVIATPERYDRVSAMGFAYGYVGSVILLVFNLVLIQFAEPLGLPGPGFATRLAFVSVGLWWLGFALIPFRRLPSDSPERPQPELLTRGAKELKKVWRALQGQRHTKTFLWSFFAYSAGVQTVLFLAATFAEKELAFETSELILLILLLQLVAIFGAYLFAWLSEWRGNKFSLTIALLIWTTICIVGYFVTIKWHFYALAGGVGLVMGGIQSLSRSTYSKLLPAGTQDPTSYFSFYDVLEKVAIILGTFLFGFMEQLTGSMRSSLLLLGFFFIVGLLLLRSVRMPAEKITATASLHR